MPSITLAHLRRYAIARSLFKPTTLPRAIAKLGFIQADPIRAPARAQDLTLRHRVTGYRAGELERRYPRLAIDEDYLVNYGFLAREHLALMHPRVPRVAWDEATEARAAEILAFVRERGRVHPRDVDLHFAHGRSMNAWGGQSAATTRVLDGLHYRGLLRVVKREAGIRIYAPHEHVPRDDSPASRREQAEGLCRLVIEKYAPLSATGLGKLVHMLRYGAPHLGAELKTALARIRRETAGVTLDRVHWLWPEGEDPRSRRHHAPEVVRLLAPFDPVVWDRTRFEHFWGWAYRFEAYVPEEKRQLGYYALPMLWREQVIGWGNLSVKDGVLRAKFGYVARAASRDPVFKRELEAELQRMREFLGLPG